MRLKIYYSSLLETVKNEQIHTKAQETKAKKFNQPRETFSFEPRIPIEVSLMVGLQNLEV